MRAIKFRVWDGVQFHFWGIGIDENTFVSPPSFLGKHSTKRPDTMNHEQFTGLLDADGEEIYEGDKVQTDSGDVLIVGWSDHYASFVLDKDGWAFQHYFGEAVDPHMVKVIGNIHENKGA